MCGAVVMGRPVPFNDQKCATAIVSTELRRNTSGRSSGMRPLRHMIGEQPLECDRPAGNHTEIILADGILSTVKADRLA
jgi:hypothetical protein